jgi:hypothetical protein
MNKLNKLFEGIEGIRVVSREEAQADIDRHAKKYGRWVVETDRYYIQADGRTFELFVVDHGEALSIFEHDSDQPPMEFDDVEEAWTTWRDLHEQFNVPFTQEEIEMLDTLEIPYDRETGIDGQ